MNLSSQLQGHLWTIGLAGKNILFPPHIPEASFRWSAHVKSAEGEPVLITGELTEVDFARPDTLVLLVHGLGGSAHSAYMLDAARQCTRLGWSSLRISLRGVDSPSNDIYHAGLTADLHQLLLHPSLKKWRRIFVVGFSLGGHLAMKMSTESELDPRVQKIAAVCAPIDLVNVIHHIDSPDAWFYREYVLSSLKRHHHELVRRGHGIAPDYKVRRVHKLRDFDAFVIATRYGFASPEDYYQSQSVASRLDDIAVPLLYVGAESDPMIPSDNCKAALACTSVDTLEVRWLDRGGHVFIPDDVSLGFGGDSGVIPQILEWFELD